MAVIKIHHKGNFNGFEKFVNRALKKDYLNILSKYGERGVAALRQATPLESGETANAWNYEIEEGNGYTTLYFTNSNENQGQNIAILLIYGHGLQNGGYVEGNDFVTPALEPVFKELADRAWREVVE